MSNTLYDLRKLIRQLSADELILAKAYVRNIISARATAEEVKAWNEFAAKVNRGDFKPAASPKEWLDNVSAFTPKPKTGIEIDMDLS